MATSPTHEDVRAVRATREHVSALLVRYPDISPTQSGEVLDFVKTARHLDIGLLSADKAVGPRLDAFMEDHKTHLGVTPGEVVRLLAALTAVLLVCWAAWELGGALLG